MNKIQFVNQEIVGRGETNKGLRILWIVCAAALTLAILIMVLMEDDVSIFVGVIMPIFLWRAALRKPVLRPVTVLVEEELEQTDNGICLHIPQIDRGDEMGTHQEQITYPRERMKSLIFHTQSKIAEITGRPFFQFQSDTELTNTDSADFENDYIMRLHCNEDNYHDILLMLENGFQVQAEPRED